MKIITNDSVTPPGGWRYTQGESDFEMRDISLLGLRDQIKRHRAANGYDLADGWWEEVQMELCIGLEDSHCAPDTEFHEEVPDRLRIVDLLRFFRAIREWKIRYGLRKVDHERAEARAATCAACPLNVTVKGCSGCQGVVRWLGEFLTEEDSTIHEAELKNCQRCKCVLSLKIHLPLEVNLASASRGAEFPEWCWMVTEDQR